jgi:hypothetical protein
MTLSEAIKLTDLVTKEAKSCKLSDQEIAGIQFLQTSAKKSYLIDNGWIEVPGEAGGTAWMFDVAGTPHYFDLEAAYELEMHGAGHYSLVGEDALGGLLSANDVALGEAQEAAYFAEHGVHRGIPPNY